MTLDVRGSLKNTKISSNLYTVFEELLSNAIDSFLIRRHKEPKIKNLRVKFKITFAKTDLWDGEDLNVVCIDNGCGINDEELKSFLTKDTSYKDDLPIPGIGKCKGAGRIQFFHHFKNVKIESNYREGGNIFKRIADYAEPQKEIDFKDFKRSIGLEADIGTKISLVELKEAARERFPQGRSLSEIFSASEIKRQMFVAFLQRLVSLKEQLGDLEICFETIHWKNNNALESIKLSDLPKVSKFCTVRIKECDPRTGDELGTFQDLNISHYKLDEHLYDLPKNAIAFCAKSSPVKEITSRYLRTKNEQNAPVEGNYHIVLIEGAFLDQHVNEQRDNFDNIPEELPTDDLFVDAKVGYDQIYEAIDPIIYDLVTPSGWKKEDVIADMAQKFGVGEIMISDTDTRIRYGDDAETVVERVLKKYQEKIIKETSELYRLKLAYPVDSHTY